jgi:shikimate dehydrogenase
VAAVIGDPVSHSRSPALHNAAFAATGLNWVYVAFPVAAGQAGSAVAAMRTLRLGGMSVTMPHKDAVAAAVDELSPAAAALGAVNCVRWSGRRLVGENTDGAGFVRSLRDEAGFDPSGRRVVVLGAGGAARAVVWALAAAGAAQVAVVNRTAVRAEAAAALAGAAGVVVPATAVSDADLVVNATSVGMSGASEGPALPCDAALLGPGQLVADLVYHPLRTALLDAAEARGATTLGGLGMLLYQAAEAFEMWTGVPAPIAAMRAALSGALKPRPS